MLRSLKSQAVAVLLLLAVSPTCAQDIAVLSTAGKTTSKTILAELLEQERHGGTVWIKQSELDPLIPKEGGGACPSAAALIAYQAMRKMAGLDPDSNPYRTVLRAFAHDRSLLQGRLTNAQVTGLLDFYGNELSVANVSIDVVSAPNSSHKDTGKEWMRFVLDEELQPNRTLQILSYTVTTQEGVVRGRHFVILSSVNGNEVSVVDPVSPSKERQYRVELQGGSTDRVFLRFPPQLAHRTEAYELNTIFTIKVQRKPSSGSLIPTEGTPVVAVTNEIDLLAKKLTDAGQLRSPRKWREEGARFGLPALDLPSDVGGANWSAVKMLEVFRHAGRHDLNLRDVVGGAHGRVLLKSDSPELRDVLQQVADGKAYIAITITEPNTGTDYTAMESVCEKVPGGYKLNGRKRFNARLDQATHIVIFTKSNTGNAGRLNVFLVPVTAPGITIERFGAHGLVGNSYGGLTMKDVFVPEANRIGSEDDGYRIFNDHFRYWRLMQAASAIGTAEKALDMMADRLKTRHVNGKPIGRFTHLQQPMGQHWIELQMAHSLAVKAAELIDNGQTREADLLVCGLKAEGVEIALKAVDAAARAFGGEGYSDLVDIGDRLQDLNGLRIADGTTDVMRSAVVAKHFDPEFWDMAIDQKPASEQHP